MAGGLNIVFSRALPDEKAPILPEAQAGVAPARLPPGFTWSPDKQASSTLNPTDLGEIVNPQGTLPQQINDPGVLFAQSRSNRLTPGREDELTPVSPHNPPGRQVRTAEHEGQALHNIPYNTFNGARSYETWIWADYKITETLRTGGGNQLVSEFAISGLKVHHAPPYRKAEELELNIPLTDASGAPIRNLEEAKQAATMIFRDSRETILTGLGGGARPFKSTLPGGWNTSGRKIKAQNFLALVLEALPAEGMDEVKRAVTLLSVGQSYAAGEVIRKLVLSKNPLARGLGEIAKIFDDIDDTTSIAGNLVGINRSFKAGMGTNNPIEFQVQARKLAIELGELVAFAGNSAATRGLRFTIHGNWYNSQGGFVSKIRTLPGLSQAKGDAQRGGNPGNTQQRRTNPELVQASEVVNGSTAGGRAMRSAILSAQANPGLLSWMGSAKQGAVYPFADGGNVTIMAKSANGHYVQFKTPASDGTKAVFVVEYDARTRQLDPPKGLNNSTDTNSKRDQRLGQIQDQGQTFIANNMWPVDVAALKVANTTLRTNGNLQVDGGQLQNARKFLRGGGTWRVSVNADGSTRLAIVEIEGKYRLLVPSGDPNKPWHGTTVTKLPDGTLDLSGPITKLQKNRNTNSSNNGQSSIQPSPEFANKYSSEVELAQAIQKTPKDGAGLVASFLANHATKENIATFKQGQIERRYDESDPRKERYVIVQRVGNVLKVQACDLAGKPIGRYIGFDIQPDGRIKFHPKLTAALDGYRQNPGPNQRDTNTANGEQSRDNKASIDIRGKPLTLYTGSAGQANWVSDINAAKGNSNSPAIKLQVLVNQWNTAENLKLIEKNTEGGALYPLRNPSKQIEGYATRSGTGYRIYPADANGSGIGKGISITRGDNGKGLLLIPEGAKLGSNGNPVYGARDLYQGKDAQTKWVADINAGKPTAVQLQQLVNEWNIPANLKKIAADTKKNGSAQIKTRDGAVQGVAVVVATKEGAVYRFYVTDANAKVQGQGIGITIGAEGRLSMPAGSVPGNPSSFPLPNAVLPSTLGDNPNPNPNPNPNHQNIYDANSVGSHQNWVDALNLPANADALKRLYSTDGYASLLALQRDFGQIAESFNKLQAKRDGNSEIFSIYFKLPGNERFYATIIERPSVGVDSAGRPVALKGGEVLWENIYQAIDKSPYPRLNGVVVGVHHSHPLQTNGIPVGASEPDLKAFFGTYPNMGKQWYISQLAYQDSAGKTTTVGVNFVLEMKPEFIKLGAVEKRRVIEGIAQGTENPNPWVQIRNLGTAPYSGTINILTFRSGILVGLLDQSNVLGAPAGDRIYGYTGDLTRLDNPINQAMLVLRSKQNYDAAIAGKNFEINTNGKTYTVSLRPSGSNIRRTVDVTVTDGKDVFRYSPRINDSGILLADFPKVVRANWWKRFTNPQPPAQLTHVSLSTSEKFVNDWLASRYQLDPNSPVVQKTAQILKQRLQPGNNEDRVALTKLLNDLAGQTTTVQARILASAVISARTQLEGVITQDYPSLVKAVGDKITADGDARAMNVVRRLTDDEAWQTLKNMDLSSPVPRPPNPSSQNTDANQNTPANPTAEAAINSLGAELKFLFELNQIKLEALNASRFRELLADTGAKGPNSSMLTLANWVTANQAPWLINSDGTPTQLGREVTQIINGGEKAAIPKTLKELAEQQKWRRFNRGQINGGISPYLRKH